MNTALKKLINIYNSEKYQTTSKNAFITSHKNSISNVTQKLNELPKFGTNMQHITYISHRDTSF